jgi:ATP-binding cassette subfamily F protein 3
VLVGLEEPTEGSVYSVRGINIGYLPQEVGISDKQTLWQECLDAMVELRSLEADLAELEAEMTDPDRADEALRRYGHLQEEFEQRGGYTYEARIKSTLSGLGFDATDYQRPVYQLSGGQRTRAALARLLLSDPDLLVLDEPTNHLDLNAVEWLEGYLYQWEGAVLIVSHDRYFLDKVVDHIWEMDNKRIETYRGNYSAFVQQRQERWDLRQKLSLTEKERLEKELDFIKRNIASQATQQAKGKLRRLSREVRAIEKLGFEKVQAHSWAEISHMVSISDHMMPVSEVEQRIHALRSLKRRPPRLHINLDTRIRSGELVLRTKDLEIGYHDEGHPLFRAPDLVLRRGECAAIIGPNGAGKTTFLKTLLQQMPPYSGEVILGASLQIGYFAQAHEDLDRGRTLVEEIEAVAPKMLLAEIRGYLARFSFTRDEVFKRVSTLSGGERGRLALAKLSLTQANLLLLDEPTNQLDIPSQEILQEVLSEYQGTIMLVSHDRYLIDALGTQIWEIEPDEAHLRLFEGSYSEYSAHLEAQKGALTAVTRKETKAYRRRTGRSSSAVRKRRARLQEIEKQVSVLEKRIGVLAKLLENPPSETEKVQQLGHEYVKVEVRLELLIKEWEELSKQS